MWPNQLTYVVAQEPPFEVKRLIIDYSDLSSIKTLRQVSKGWAAAGLEVLLLPTFTVKSFLDIHRLISIGTSPHFSQQAARTVKTLAIQSNGWDPEYFRMLFTSRHELRSNYEEIHFVPTQAEQEALYELDAMIERKDIDNWEENHVDYEDNMLKALGQLPALTGISIRCPNPFKDRLLRKTWEEYDLEVIFDMFSQSQQLFDILRFARQCGLTIHHLTHDKLLSGYFIPSSHTGRVEHVIQQKLTAELQSLKLHIVDMDGRFSDLDASGQEDLRTLICASPNLHTLKISFVGSGLAPMSCIPTTTHFHNLHTLSLQVTCDPDKFISFLGLHKSTLRRLQISMDELKEGDGTWKTLLDRIRLQLGSTLEKFEMYGNVRSVDGDENWMIFPIYKEDWTLYQKPRSWKGKEIEDFVLRGGIFPEMVHGFSI